MKYRMKKVFYTLILVFIFLISFSTSVWAVIDTRNANFSDPWIDLVVPGSGYDLRVKRSYNSRTLFNGIFGFGWCANFESKIEKTSTGDLKLTECGGGLEVTFKSGSSSYQNTLKVIDKIVAALRQKKKRLSESYFTKLKGELEYDNNLREKYANNLKIKRIPVRSQRTFYANGRADENIKLDEKYYVRSLPNGTYEKYNMKGQLKYIYDKNGNYLKIKYNGKKIVSVIDNQGRRLMFKYQGDKVSSIQGPNGLSVSYKHKDEDLVYVKNAWKNEYTYKYDDLHNLVRINYPDKTFKAISYNKDKDWVTSFIDRRKCIESYKYESDPNDPLNHYTSYIEKKCNGKITNVSSYEFLYRKRKNGSRYLARTRSDNNGDIVDMFYHPVFGKPTSVLRNGITLVYTYYPSGMVKKRREPTQTSSFQYKNKCQKVSHVVTKSYQIVRTPSHKKTKHRADRKSYRRKLVKTVRSYFEYDKAKCNLALAKNSIGQVARISHDQRGRIQTIKDQSQKIISINYEERFSKPSKITRPGLGSLSVSYKLDGSLKNVSSDQGPSVAVQIASVFNNLLEIISPVSSDLGLDL